MAHSCGVNSKTRLLPESLLRVFYLPALPAVLNSEMAAIAAQEESQGARGD